MRLGVFESTKDAEHTSGRLKGKAVFPNARIAPSQKRSLCWLHAVLVAR